MYWIWLLTYRDGLKGGPQVLWNDMKKLRSPACSRQENAIFHFMVTKPGVHLLGHPVVWIRGELVYPSPVDPGSPEWGKGQLLSSTSSVVCLCSCYKLSTVFSSQIFNPLISVIVIKNVLASIQCHSTFVILTSQTLWFIIEWSVIATVMTTISIEMPWI